jgi:predicted DNA binding CopG/RHH family protein
MSKKKDDGLIFALADIMGTGQQETTESLQAAHNEPTEGLQAAHKRPTMEPIRLRLTKADLEALDVMAAQEGATRSTLIRRAVKELLRRGR